MRYVLRLFPECSRKPLEMAMRMRGLEPPRPYGHTDLNRARLPIPPHPLAAVSVARPRFCVLGGCEALLNGFDVAGEVGLALLEPRFALLELGETGLHLVLAQLQLGLAA